MSKETKNLNLPVHFTIDDTFDNERFLKLRVKVMHTGLNLNNYHFGAEAIEKAAPTLSNIPLLAFIKKVDGEENDDFAGHEYEIRITKDGAKFVYLGRPIGIIPETNNYSLETDESGKTFVVVDAYVWRDYANKGLDIIERDGIKKVSMEIKLDGYSLEDSYIEILDYSYIGVALLGEDVNEAMIGAKAEVVNFSSTFITSLMEELKSVLNFETEVKPAEEEYVKTFEFSHEEIRAKLYKLLDSEEGYSWIVEVYDDFFIYQKEEDRYFKQGYIKEEEKVVFAGEKIEVFSSFLTAEEVENLKAIKENFNVLKLENKELKEFKNEIEKSAAEQEIKKLFSSFSDLSKEVLENLSSLNLPYEELEVRLYAERGKMVEKPAFSRKIAHSFGLEQSSKGKEPIYSDLIREYKGV